MMIITLEVTAADIAQGKPDYCSRCPVALALVRAMPEGHWSAHYGGLVCRKQSVVFYAIPPEVRQWMMLFDQGARVEPFTVTFELEPRMIDDQS